MILVTVAVPEVVVFLEGMLLEEVGLQTVAGRLLEWMLPAEEDLAVTGRGLLVAQFWLEVDSVNLMGLILSILVLVVLAMVVSFSEGMLLAKVGRTTVAGRV